MTGSDGSGNRSTQAARMNHPCVGCGAQPFPTAFTQRGFTLVEMLVVILIISVLAGLTMPAINAVRRSADKKACKQEIALLSLAVENFADQDEYGDWPPATLDRLGISGANEENQGIEGLVLCLATQRGEGPYFTDFKPEQFTNTDDDMGPENVLKGPLNVPFKDAQLREYTDLWGNPYIYMPFRSYGEKFLYIDSEGEAFDACLEKDPETGMWPAPLKFVIWSCGPNGENENGGGDDVASWR